jgi:hypothetical protein
VQLPKTPAVLGNRLAEIAPLLRAQGVLFRRYHTGKQRRIHFQKIADSAVSAVSAVSASSESPNSDANSEPSPLGIAVSGAPANLNSETDAPNSTNSTNGNIGDFNINADSTGENSEERARVHRLEKSPTVPSLSSLPSLAGDTELNSEGAAVTIPSDGTAVSSLRIVTPSGANVNSESRSSDDSDGSDDTVGVFINAGCEEPPLGEDSSAPVPEYGEPRRQAILRRYLQQQGYLIEGDTPEAHAARSERLLDAAACAGYPALRLNERYTGEGEAYWRVQAAYFAARPLECAIAIELFARAAGTSPRRCLDCGGRFSSESALFCARCCETAGACPHCGASRQRTQIFDGSQGLCHACRRLFPLPDALRASHGAESILNEAGGSAACPLEGG